MEPTQQPFTSSPLGSNNISVIPSPCSKKHGTESIHEIPSGTLTPVNEIASPDPTPTSSSLDLEKSIVSPKSRLLTARGISMLVITCGAQLLDNIYMTGVNISLPAIQSEFSLPANSSGQLQWLLSAYTLTFGGFLLLSGALADRYGRKNIFCIGMAWLSIWTLAAGFATSFIQLAIFRALQGLGAAMSVPSAIGLLSTHFTNEKDRTKALSYFGASGAVGFCLGLILGGFLTSSLGWRYLFYITVTITSLITLSAIFLLPSTPRTSTTTTIPRPKLDILGASLSTISLLLFSLSLSLPSTLTWHYPLPPTLLALSVLILALFVYTQSHHPNPILPLTLFSLPSFPGIFLTSFLVYAAYQTIVYYTVLTSQEALHLSAGTTALYFLPMGVFGGSLAIGMGSVLSVARKYRFGVKGLLLLGLALEMLSPIPSAVMIFYPSNIRKTFWMGIFPTSLLSVGGIAIAYCTITVVMVSTVPVERRGLVGGLTNCAFQLGSAVGLVVAEAVVQGVIGGGKDGGVLERYCVGLWVCVGMAGVGLGCSLFGVRAAVEEKRDGEDS